MKVLEKKKKEQKAKIGFENNSQIKTNSNYDVEEFIDFGLSKELVARFTYQVYMKSYTIEDFKNIMLYSKLSPLKMLQEYLKIFGFETTYTDDFLEAMAINAYNSHLEARGLQQKMNQIKMDLLKRINQEDRNYQSILLKIKENDIEEDKKLIRSIN